MGYFKTEGGVSTPFLQWEGGKSPEKTTPGEYWFKNNGKDITQAEYCEAQGKISNETQGGGLQTNHPDACGLKAKRNKEREDNQKKPK